MEEQRKQALPIILAIETVTSSLSTAVLQGDRLLAETTVNADRRFVEQLPAVVNESLDKAGVTLHDLTHLAVSIGPGSFTGVRVGVAYAKGLAIGLNIGIIPVLTLQALALSISQEHPDEDVVFCPMTIARRGESFMQLFRLENGYPVEMGELTAVTLADFLSLVGDIPVVCGGEGAVHLLGNAEDLPANVTLHHGVQAVASDMGRCAVRLLSDEGYVVPPLDEVVPYYFKEFTVHTAGKV